MINIPAFPDQIHIVKRFVVGIQVDGIDSTKKGGAFFEFGQDWDPAVWYSSKNGRTWLTLSRIRE